MTDIADLIGSITQLHARSQHAFFELMRLPEHDYGSRCAAHREYREATRALIDVLLEHNRIGAPQPWDIAGYAQPLVQQALIEAGVLDTLDEREDAKAVRAQAFDLADRHLPAPARARINRDQATQLALAGHFNQALALLDDTRRIFEELDDPVQAAQTALDEVVLLEWLGDADRALAVLAAARELVPKRERGAAGGMGAIGGAALKELFSIVRGHGPTGGADRAAALWRIETELVEHEARARKAREEWDHAARLFESVLDHYWALGPAVYGIEFQLVAIDVGRGEYEAARRRLESIAPHFDAGVLRTRRAALHNLRADIALGTGSPDVALAAARQAATDVEEHPDLDLEWRVHWRRARALEAIGRAGEALDAYLAAAQVIDSLRRTPLGYRLDTTYIASKRILFDAAIALAARADAPRQCAVLIELIKSRSLTANLSVPSERQRSQSPGEVEFDSVTRRLDALEYAGFRGEGGKTLRDEHDALVRRRIELMERIRLRDARWRGLTAPLPLDLDASLALFARRGLAALTLYVWGDHVISVLLVHGATVAGTRRLDAETLAALDSYEANLRLPAPDVFKHDFSDEFGIGADAFVPDALLERALEADAVVVAPHSRLHLLPWPALTFRGRRLFEHRPIGVLPSLAVAAFLDRDVPANQAPGRVEDEPDAGTPRAAVIGAPDYSDLPRVLELPKTRLAVDEIAAVYEGRLLAAPVTGEHATEAALRELLAHPSAHDQILHVSCHGTLDHREPMSSGLLMADSKLDAAEIALLRIDYHEVVLGACSTGWRPLAAEGITLHGDDVLGLPGALFEAGARSIVVSISKANESANRAFMVKYHRRRAAGRSPLAAFQETQLAMLASDEAPSSWAGIVCYAAE